MISFFRSKSKFQNPLHTDVHSHLLAALDDGVRNHEEAIELVRNFYSLGYRKLITTPHVNSDYYRNEPSSIRQTLHDLKNLVAKENIPISIEAAAEYYLDEELMKKVEARESLLTFGQMHVLFETNFLNEPYQLNDFIFQVITQGYKPILAHPERYAYMTMEKAEELRDRGALLQINIPSILGYYSKPIQRLAIKFIEQGWVDLLGSDCHNQNYIHVLEAAPRDRYFRKAVDLPLLNNTL